MINQKDKTKLKKIANIAQLAAVIEASTQKPGNVGPDYDFEDTKYEHFLAGGIAIGPAIEDSALNGFMAGEGEISIAEIRIGTNIKNAVRDVKNSHTGGNTHLGMIMLFVPIAAAAGMCIANGTGFGSELLRENIKKIIGNSTVNDAVEFYDAIRIAGAGGLNGNWLGTDDMNAETRPDVEFDARDSKSKKKLIEEAISFYDLLKLSSKKDRIAEELTNGMEIVFNSGVPALDMNYERTRDIRKSVVQAYLYILSKFPDTLIAKRVGIKKAREISTMAGGVFEAGGVMTDEGKKAVDEFNRNLHVKDNKLNPGTTADLVAASLMVRSILLSFSI